VDQCTYTFFNDNLKERQVIESKRNAMRSSKGWAILSEACMRTTRRTMSEGLMGADDHAHC
jgi:hypothetical protein